MNKTKINPYHTSIRKTLFDYGLIFLLSPLLFIIFIFTSSLIIIISGLPVFFIQERTGMNGKVFKLFKFRTMIKGADRQQEKYKKLNEADGPVFKIRNDPRLTKFGKLLYQTGLDELPQLINVIKGEMSLVGPRPLPVYEARLLTKEQNLRLLVKPGITSLWIVNGYHKHTFNNWMKMDKDYVKNATLITDITIIYKTVLLLVNSVFIKIS